MEAEVMISQDDEPPFGSLALDDGRRLLDHDYVRSIPVAAGMISCRETCSGHRGSEIGGCALVVDVCSPRVQS